MTRSLIAPGSPPRFFLPLNEVSKESLTFPELVETCVKNLDALPGILANPGNRKTIRENILNIEFRITKTEQLEIDVREGGKAATSYPGLVEFMFSLLGCDPGVVAKFFSEASKNFLGFFDQEEQAKFYEMLGGACMLDTAVALHIYPNSELLNGILDAHLRVIPELPELTRLQMLQMLHQHYIDSNKPAVAESIAKLITEAEVCPPPKNGM